MRTMNCFPIGNKNSLIISDGCVCPPHLCITKKNIGHVPSNKALVVAKVDKATLSPEQLLQKYPI